MLERLSRMPLPVLPTMVGAMTLSNLYDGLGFSWIRTITFTAGIIIFLLYILKIVKHPDIVKGEYAQTVPMSLYAAFLMMGYLIASFINPWMPWLAKPLFLISLILYVIHIALFTYRNVIKNRFMDTFVPSWFVTYNGIMVSCVVGAFMQMNQILQYVVWYGIVIYFILLPVMIYRLIRHEVKMPVYHTMAILLAPCSLCLVSYLNVIPNPMAWLVLLLYACVLCSLIFIILMLPRFFAFPFAPGYAGLTFPMAIGCVATNKMTAWIASVGADQLAANFQQIYGIQLYLTTTIVGWVLINFLISALRIERKG